MARRKGFAGLVALVGAALVAAFAPASAIAHPACATGATTFLSLNAGWAGELPTGEELSEAECSLIDVEAALTQNIETTAAADPIDPLVPLFNKSANMTLRGYSARNLPLTGALAGINSDLAFKGNYAIQGHWNGFRILDVSDPANPTQVSNYEACVHPSGQGDVVVYGDLLIRTWDSASNTTALTCGGQSVGTGFEGIHLFNIADPANPVYIRKLRMSATENDLGAPPGCGAHTATAVPDAARGYLYLYVGGSSGACTGIDIVRIKISDPTDTVYLRRSPAGRQCHDNNVIMGNVNLAMCAGGNGFSVLKFDPSIDPDVVGGIANPALLYSRSMGVGTGHSGSFSYDGKVLIFGHEPGGGTQAQCQAGSSTLNKSLFFIDPATGNTLGTFVHVRPQGNQENCTWHNFNVVPTHKGNIVVTGNYQSGISVLDFTNPAVPQEIAYADPAPLTPSTPIVTGGDWSTYWHNGRLYEADIRRGLLVWDLNEDSVLRAKTLTGDHNPQTQTSSYEQDLTGPTIEVVSPASGPYTQGGSIPALYSCTDTGGSGGVESCVGTVANGSPFDTSSAGTKQFTVTAKDNAGNVTTKTVSYAVNNVTGTVTGTVPGTLSLTVGPPATFGAFTPGVARTYNTQTSANVISTGGDALLSVADGSSTNTGHLVNGAFFLPQPLKARALNAANPGTVFANVGSAAAPLNLLTYGGPASNDPVTLQFEQQIAANDPLRTGTYSKTLTFTLSTTAP